MCYINRLRCFSSSNVNMRRIVRFHPKSNNKDGYDKNTVLKGLLSEDGEAHVGAKASVFEGNTYDPSELSVTAHI